MKLFDFWKKKPQKLTEDELKELVDGLVMSKMPGHGDWRDAKMATDAHNEVCEKKLRSAGKQAIPYLMRIIHLSAGVKLLAEMEALNTETILKHVTEDSIYGIMIYLRKKGKDLGSKEKIIPLYRQQLEEHMMNRTEAMLGLAAYGVPDAEGELLKFLEDILSNVKDENGEQKLGYTEKKAIAEIAPVLGEMKVKGALEPLKALVENEKLFSSLFISAQPIIKRAIKQIEEEG
jgi:hypothetical protein